MQRRTLTILVFAFVIMFFSSSVFGQSAKSPGSEATPIRIGGALSLTGAWGEAGKWVKAGYDAWLEEINKKGGLLSRPVEMVVYDNESNTEKAVTYYERAITIDKVDLIFGGVPGTANVAIMPLAEKYGKVFVGLGGHMKSFEQGYTYVFASPPLMADWSYLSLTGVLDDLIPKANWPKSIAVLTMNSVTGLSGRAPMIKGMEERGIKVVVDETYNLPLSDATPLISKAKERGAEILCCYSVFDDGAMMMRAAKALRYNPKIIWQLVASKVPAWIKELGEDGNHVLTDTSWAADLPYPGNTQINEGAQKRLGIPRPPDFYGLGYCWMKTLELAVQGSGTLDNKKIRDYIRSTKFDLPYGKGVTFDKRGLPAPFCFTFQTTTGQNKLVWPKEVATSKLVYPRPPWSQ
ncbi:MAG TPA: amino acid ABC transporter substrate-binding protein [Thermodesulfobacteriota bacterium]|nr:amino acid ABC transporter substrate-binding protein [Thermodesulfobacteriota bacterium]